RHRPRSCRPPADPWAGPRADTYWRRGLLWRGQPHLMRHTMADDTPTLTVTIDADTRPLEAQLAEVSKAGARFSSALSQSFVDLAIKGKSFGDVLRALALRLSEIALKAAFKPLTDALGASLASALGGGLAFAKGAVIGQGLPVPFAEGGVI